MCCLSRLFGCNSYSRCNNGYWTRTRYVDAGGRASCRNACESPCYRCGGYREY